MNILFKIYCRTYQLCFKLALPILPYRDPKIIDKISIYTCLLICFKNQMHV